MVKKKNKQRTPFLKGSSLAYALLLIIIISAISGLLLLLHDYKQKNYQHLIQQEKLRDNTLSILKYESSIIGSLKKDSVFDLYGFDNDSVLFNSFYHGVLKVNYASAFKRNDTVSKLCLSAPLIKNNLNAIVLSNTRFPLSISGNTSVIGKCYVPNSSISTSNFKGELFSGVTVEKSNIANSPKVFPLLNKLFNEIFNQSNEIKLYEDLPYLDTLKNSFTKVKQQFFVKNGSQLSRMIIDGNILLFNPDFIIIPSDAILKNVIVVSPKIIVQKGFSGSAQLFATDSIVIGQNVHLKFPSIIFIKNSVENNSVVEIKIGSAIEGAIIVQEEDLQSDNLPENKLIISSNSLIKGSVYNRGKCLMEGKINGTIYTDLFYQADATALRYNLLYNAIINPDESEKEMNFIEGISSGFVSWID